MIESIKRAWGVGSPRGFKVAAWIVAFSVFGAWQYFDNKKSLPSIVDFKNTSPVKKEN